MRTVWKKCLSFLLAFTMLLSMLPATAFAANAPITLYLSGDNVTVGAKVTVTANGQTRTATVNKGSGGTMTAVVTMNISRNDTVHVTIGDASGTGIAYSYGIGNSNFYAYVTLTGGSGSGGSGSGGSEYQVYIYTLIPGVDVGSSTDADNVWNGMGIGTGNGLENPANYYQGYVVSTDPEEMVDLVHFPESGFPNITANGVSYRYAAPGSGNEEESGYYTIQWTKLVVSAGANTGNNNYNRPAIDSNINTYHLDGVLILNEAKYYTITFMLQDAGTTSFTNLSDNAQRVEEETPESLLHLPSLNQYKTVSGVDYVLDCWYEDSTFQTPASFSGTIEANKTYYARYVPDNFTVRYNLNGGDSDFDFDDQVKVYGEPLTLYSVEPTRDDYKFVGWNTRSNGAGDDYKAGGQYSKNADATLYAQWEPLPGTLVVEKTLWGLTELPEDFYILVESTEDTYTLTEDNVTSFSVISASGPIVFTWELDNVPAAQYDIEEFHYTEEGYDLLGHSVTDTFAAVAPNGSAIASLNNIYQIKTFDVIWQDAGGELLESDTDVEYGTYPSYDDADPTRADCIFLGWTSDNGATVLKENQLPAVTEDVTYTAVYAQLFTVTYTDGVAENVFADQVYENVPAGTETPDFVGNPDVRPGYDFDGWKPTVSSTVTDHVTYVAQWTPADDTEYTVKHYIQNADDTGWILKETEVLTGTTGETVTADDIAIDDYVFVSDYAGNITSGVIEADGSLVLELYYRPVFTVTWMHAPDVDTRTLETDTGVVYGSDPSFNKTAPSRAADAQNDYVFAGWSEDPDAAAADALPEENLPVVTKDTTYYAIFQVIPHTFTGTIYVVLDGSANADGTLKTGTLKNVNELTNDDGDLFLSADGVTFYALQHTAVGTYVHTALPVGDYRAYYEQDASTLICPQQLTITKQYGDRSRILFFNSVTYDLNGGTVSGNGDAIVNYYHEGHGDVPDRIYVANYRPMIDDYNFLGWKINGSGDLLTVGNLLTASIDQPYTLVAQWEKAVNVKVVIELDHVDPSLPDAPDTSSTADDVTFTLMKGVSGAAPAVTLTKDSCNGYTYTYDDDVTTYASNGFAFTGLSAGEYTVFVEKAGYKVVSRDTVYNADKTEQTVTIKLGYVSDSFELKFDVKMASDVPETLYPKAVHVKITRWNAANAQWETIPALASANPIPVLIGADGTGSGTYTVDKAGTYRVEVISYESAEGNKIGVTTTDQKLYVSANEICYGTVTIEAPGSGFQPTGSALSGAIFETDAQSGVPTVTIDIHYGRLTFVGNGGTVNGASTYKLDELIRVPQLSAYTPIRSGGYSFQGYTWYRDTDRDGEYADEVPTTALADNSPLNDHYILVANWIDPITVQGSVYVQQNKLDPISSLTLLLQRSTVSNSDEHFTTIATKTLTIPPFSGTEHVDVAYTFEQLENVGTYRIRILTNDNFEVIYQNEPDSKTSATSFDTYSVSKNIAVLDGDNEAVVNAHVAFNPHTVKLPFVINATAIGTAFQPTEATMEILYRGTESNYSSYPVEPGRSNPVTLTVTQDAQADSYTFDVLPQTASVTYNFAMRMTAESITASDGNDETTILSNPYYGIVYQNWPAYYLSGKWSGTLTAVLTPKTYSITYVLNDGEWRDGDIPPSEHKWSFDTAIPTPVREGYLFMGWQAETEGTYANGKIPASVAQKVKLTAIWEKDQLNEVDPNQGKGDSIPDKFQRKVTFKVENGAWADSTTTDQVFVVTLKTDGVAQENGTAVITVPGVGGNPALGYEAGNWDNHPGVELTVDNTFAEGTAGTVYTYSYQRIYYIAIDPNGGNWSGADLTVYEKVAVDYDPSTFAGEKPTREGFVFDDWDLASDTGDTYQGGLVIHVFTARWEEDQLNKNDPFAPGSDGIADKDQRKVTFKVQKGAWNDETTDDLVYIVILQEGTASLDVPAVGGKPDSGYMAGSWDQDLSAVLTVDTSFAEGAAGTVYTYSYLGNYIVVKPNGGTWRGTEANTYLLTDPAFYPEAPARQNYAFLGWLEAADGVTTYSDGIVSKVYTAEWIHNSLLVYPATVTLRLDNVNADLSALHDGATGIQLRSGEKVYALNRTETGVYTENVPSGTYYIDRVEGDHTHQIGQYQMIVNTLGGSRIIDHYSVTYDVNGGEWPAGTDLGEQVFFKNTLVSTVSAQPVREGYAFKGWSLGGKTFAGGEQFTASLGIETPVVLTAVWEKLVNVKVNVTINYEGGGGIDRSDARDEVSFTLLRDTGSAKEPAGSMVTLTETSYAGYDKQSAAGGIRYTATANTYEALPAGSYTVSVVKSGYTPVIDATTIAADGTQIVNVVLTFNPDSFDLAYDVQMEDGIPEELWPDAVNVKATYWGDDGTGNIGWHVIDLPPVTVTLDANGTGTGQLSVWKHLSGSEQAYDYRVMVSGFVYNTRAVVAATEIKANEVYSDGNYTASVTVPGGRTSGDGLAAAYYGTSAQVGRPLVTVTVETYDVTFDANGGTVNGKTADTVTDVYAIPAFAGFVPARESYVFGGWYKDAACTVPATEGQLLTADVTLYARWSPIQAITGNVTVEGTYMHNGQLVEVHAIDRTTKIHAALQQYDTNSDTVIGTLEITEVVLTWPETPTGDGTGSYSFTGLQALPAGHSYRVLVYMTNYASYYLNEVSVGGAYTADANLAVFQSDPTATFVHADLKFAPDSYNQEVIVDATAIGEDLRPNNAMVKILYWEQGTFNPYQPISQHDVQPYGLSIPMDKTIGTGSGSEPVWKWNWTDKLYDYMVQLIKINGKDYTGSDPRFSVTYGEEVFWDMVHNKAPEALTVKLTPNTYDVIFDMNAPGMSNVVAADAHTWSHITDIADTAKNAGIYPAPVRSGYVFMGWYATPDHSGSPVTFIDDSVYTDTTLYAYWETDVLEEESTPGTIGDGIPDIYQCVVTFEIVGGTWGVHGNSAPLQRVYTLREKNASGIWTVKNNVTLGSRIPNNMARGGVVDLSGHWNPNATTTTPVTGNAIYTYTYRNAITATVENGSFLMDGVTYTNTTHSVPHDYSEVNTSTITFAPAAKHMLLSATLNGAEITGFNNSITLKHDLPYTVHVVYTPDLNGDSHPDIYQKKVNFVIQNGTWENGTTTITQHVPLYNASNEYDVNGSGTVTIPTPIANSGYKQLGWDVTPSATVSGTAEVTYTFRCVPTTVDLYHYNVEHWRQQPDGRYALESSEHKQVSVELNAKGDDFEPGKEPSIALTPMEYKTYAHYMPCGPQHDTSDGTHEALVLSAKPASIKDTTVLKMFYHLNTYTLSYDLGDGVTGLTTPDSSSKLYGNGHDVSQAPAREGYAFLGWQYGNQLLSAGATLHLEGNVQLTAQWAKLEYTVNYLDKDTNTVLQTAKIASAGKLGDQINVADEIIAAIGSGSTNYVFHHADLETLTITLDSSNGNSNNVINLYYAADMVSDPAVDPDPSTPGDGIPDQYQATITYRVQDGKWADGTTADIKKIFTLAEKSTGGVWTPIADVTLGSTIPVAETSETHTGKWYPAITAQTAVTGDATYVYAFTALPTSTVSYDLAGGTGAAGEDYSTVTVVTGTTVTVKAAPEREDYYFEGYSFKGNIYRPGDVVTVTEDILFVAIWEEDSIDIDNPGAGSGGSSDGIPDKYQATITYQVQGGKWADGTTADIKKIFTLAEKSTGGVWTPIADVTLGSTIPVAETSETHTGEWYPAITAQTAVTGDATYVYSFTALPTFTVSYDLKGGTGADSVDYAPVIVVTGKTVTVKAAPTLRGYRFEGYSFGGKVYKPGDVITVTENILLTAEWDKLPDPVRPPASTTGSVILTKCDAADHTTLLPRVVFDLFTKDGDYVGTYTTNARGEIQVEDLRAGSYYWVETRPTEGYELDSSEHPFTVSAGKTTEITVENARSEVPAVFSGDHYAYIIGYDDGMVRPQWKITRAEVATIFFRLLDEDTRNQFMTRSNNFSDVQDGMWFNTAVSTMASMGVINGYPDGTFQPNANITRAEFAAIAARFDANGNTTGVSFRDVYEHWAYKEISIAANNGWILGYEDGTFKPNQHITRAEAMALVNRVLQRIPEHRSDLLDDMVQWADNMDPNEWYYLTVQEATNSHDYYRKISGYEAWTALREVPDWTALER